MLLILLSPAQTLSGKTFDTQAPSLSIFSPTTVLVANRKGENTNKKTKNGKKQKQRLNIKINSLGVL